MASILALLAASVAFAAGPAAQETFDIDSARSHAEFSLRAMLLINVQGKFGAVGGTLRFDRDRDIGWVDARIDAGAVEMNSKEREDWARSEEFFDSHDHPTIRFVSDPISRALLRDGGELRGRLTLRGIEQPIQLTVLPSTCERPGRDCAMRAQGSISRSEFGMRSKRAVLGDRVLLDLSVFAESTDPAATRTNP